MEDVEIEIGGYKVLISAGDAERVMAHRWYKLGGNGRKSKILPYFAHKTTWPEHKNELLHRFIVSCPVGMLVDHINGNTLDNRRSNLRICTHAGNSQNRSMGKNNSSGYKCVYFDSRAKKKKWFSRIRVNRKPVYLGHFETPEKAYEAYVAASKKYHGEFSCVV